jgi:hypothetical protein
MKLLNQCEASGPWCSNCCRQAGKSTTIPDLALHQALFHPQSTVLLQRAPSN